MPSEIVNGFRLSYQQERTWLLGRGLDHDPFRARCVVEIKGVIDYAQLEAAIGATIARHEILRTSFRCLPGMSVPLQVIHEECAMDLALYDLAHLDQQKQLSRVEEVSEVTGRERPDGQAISPMQLSLVKLSPCKHLLLIELPALCADMEGLNNLVREISRAYQAALEGSALPGEPLQYADLSEWQNELLESDDMQAVRDFLPRKEIAELLDLSLPYERRPPDGFRPVCKTFTLARPLAEKINDLTQSLNVSASTFMLSCWQALLLRLTARSEILVGVACDGRKFDELKDALGPFAKYFPVVSHLRDGLQFDELLQSTGESFVNARRWQEYFSWSQIQTQEDQPAIFPPFGFEFRHEPIAHQAGELTFSVAERYACIERYKINLSCVEKGRELVTEFHYDTSLYSDQDIDRLAGQLQAILESAASEPTALIGKLNLLDDSQRRQLLVEFNDTRADYSADVCIHHLVEKQAERTPRHTAIEFDGDRLSYGELNARANQLARHLRRLGVGPDHLVAISAERSIEMVVGLLGILKAGGAYVPVDPEYPQDRRAIMLTDAGVRVLLTQERLIHELPETQAAIISLDAGWQAIADESEENLDSLSTPDNLAYVIYTSGSTGMPKGVMISHRAICNRLLWMQSHFPIGSGDRLLQKTPMSFDASVWEFFVPLLAGATLVMARPSGHQDSSYLVEALVRERITILQLVPTMLGLLLQEPGIEKWDCARRVYCGGEAVSAELQDRFFSTVDASLHNLYGPTESSIDATSWVCERDGYRQIVPIGRPVTNIQIYLLDSHLCPVPVGVAGELHIAGVGLARGYFNRPDLTAERFIPNPFGDQAGGRLYKTGDLARYAPGGEIEFLGRIDHQVKINGVRIELGEIESAARQHPGVREAVVIARRDEHNHMRLVAYLVPETAHAPLPADEQLYRLPNDLQIVHINKNETDLIYKEIFEDEVYLKCGISLEEGDCVFDVGANIGLFTLFLHQRFRNITTFAFEPIPPIHERLRKNVAMYGLSTRLFECGLSDSDGYAEFTFYPKWSAMSGAFADAQEDERVTRSFISNLDRSLSEHAQDLLEGRFDSQSFACPLRTLSSVIREQGVESIDLLKIDVEKSELKLLNGIDEDDWPKIKQIVMEVHDIDGRLRAIVEMLERRGFRVSTDQDELLADTGLYNVYAISHHKKARAMSARDADDLPALARLRKLLSIGDVRDFLIERLPRSMVPADFVILQSLPVLPNGKVDRNALVALSPVREQAMNDYVGPRTPVEEQLAEIWKNILGIERVGVHDNFFELGGDSILSIQVIARANKAGLKLTPKQLFEHQTIARLAETASGDSKPSDAGDANPPTGSGTADTTHGFSLSELTQQQLDSLLAAGNPIEDIYPLSPIQQGMFFHSLYAPESAVYSGQMSCAMHTNLDVQAFEKAWQRLIDRHPILRTSFAGQSLKAPVQVVYERVGLPLDHLDWRELSASEQQARLDQYLEADLERGFDFTQAPLMRIALIRMGEMDYRFVWSTHHAILDGWAGGVLIKELLALYDALCRDEEVDLGRGRPFRDYIAWLERQDLSKAERFWRETLDGFTSPTPLPADQAAVGQRLLGPAYDQQQAHLPADAWAALKAMSRQHQVTLNTIVQGAWALLLSRYSGESDVLFGNVVSGRPAEIEDVEEIVGIFINTLPARIRVMPDSHLLPWLKCVQAHQVEAREYDYSPLIKVQEWSNMAAGTPLFESLLVFENYPADKALLERGRALGVSDVRETARTSFPLSLLVVPGEQLRLCLKYDSNRFDAEAIKEMLCQLQGLLEQMAARPQSAIGSLSLVTQASRHLVPDPQEPLPEPRYESVIASFASWACRAPERKAVSQKGRDWSYGDLAASSMAIARTLNARGLERGESVAVFGRRSFGTVSSILGVLWGGGVLLTVDPNLPTYRQRLMIREANVKHLVVIGDIRPDAELWDELASVNVLTVDDEQGAVDQTGIHSYAEAGEINEPGPDDPAYIFFTSGTTGTPKAIEGCHKGLDHFLSCQREIFQVRPSDRCAQLMGLSFDAVLRDILLPLTSGAVLCLPDGDDLGPRWVIDWLERESITLLHVVPTLAQTVIDGVPGGSLLPNLRLVFFVGEPLPGSLVARWRECFSPSAEFVNLYGPTETTLVKCFYRVPSDVAQGVQPAGWPMPQTQALVLSEENRMCGIGEAGEIVIRTPFRTLGYVNAAGENARKFKKNPFREDEKDLLYFTGDLGRYRCDGALEVLGRLDDQTKIRGVRVEPEEIAASLSEHPSVRSCAVTAFRDKQGQAMLAAYVVPEGEVSTAELRLHLSKRLPPAMNPAAFVFIDQLPLTSNGKLDRRSLPQPEPTLQQPAAVHVAPRTQTEQALADIWAEVLGRDPVGVEDSFFDLGGHSLLAMQVVSRIRESFGVDLPLRRLFESPTVAQLSRAVVDDEKIPGRTEKIAKALNRIKKLSPDEVNRMLEDRNQPAGELI